MGKKEEKTNDEQLNAAINHNTILLSFEGWIKYIEGFSRGLQATKTVDAQSVLECVGEIMEYMKTLKGDILDILQHCEDVLEKGEQLELENKQLKEAMAVKLLEVTKNTEEENG